ncbi:MAG: OmpA family protein, partial [Muribaculaceae bacterium]|nr:OmpA family protein [Muribaculaceae bacterium]
SHTDRVGSHEYNNSLSSRRAKSVVDYLVEHGIQRERMRPHGYGKTVPKVVTKRINRLYPQFAIGDTLNVAYTDTLSKENRAIADQINRRTEFMVLTTNFQPFVEDIKRHEEEGVPLDSLPKRNEAPDANGILMESKEKVGGLNEATDSLKLMQATDSLMMKDLEKVDLDKQKDLEKEKVHEKEKELEKERELEKMKERESGSGGSEEKREGDRGESKSDSDSKPKTKISKDGSGGGLKGNTGGGSSGGSKGSNLGGSKGNSGGSGLKGNTGGSKGNNLGGRREGGVPIIGNNERR